MPAFTIWHLEYSAGQNTCTQVLLPPLIIFHPPSGVGQGFTEDDVPPLQEPVSRRGRRLPLPDLPADLPGQHLRLPHPLGAQTSGGRVPRDLHAALLPLTLLPNRRHPGPGGSGAGGRWGGSPGLHPVPGGGEVSDGVPSEVGDDGGAAALRINAAPAEPAAGLRGRGPLRPVPEGGAAAARQPHWSVPRTG